MINDLLRPSLRPRHWKQVVRLAVPRRSAATKSLSPEEIKSLSLGRFMEFQLHGETRQSFFSVALARNLVPGNVSVYYLCIVAFCTSAHAADVRLIADRADKDLAVEMAIKTFEEVWLSRVFGVCPQQQNFMQGKQVCMGIVMECVHIHVCGLMC